jgi:branched-chain amino acid transport system ATP-binding protein
MLLDARDLHISYGDIRAVDGINFFLEKGELVSIVGANGAGKTSILNSIMGIVPLKKGTVVFENEDITSLSAHQRARAGIRMVPERARVFPRLTVYENLLTGIYGLRKSIKLDVQIPWLYDLFPILRERKDQPAATLSGGEQQQLAIARALISNPTLLLVDEVSMGLMPKLVDQVFDMLKQLNRQKELTILIVEQNAIASLEISHRAYVLETGTIVHQGAASALLEDPKIKEVYLGTGTQNSQATNS